VWPSASTASILHEPHFANALAIGGGQHHLHLMSTKWSSEVWTCGHLSPLGWRPSPEPGTINLLPSPIVPQAASPRRRRACWPFSPCWPLFPFWPSSGELAVFGRRSRLGSCHVPGPPKPSFPGVAFRSFAARRMVRSDTPSTCALQMATRRAMGLGTPSASSR
jgi:hypothetical protein